MIITRNEVEKLLATMYRLEVTEVELDTNHLDSPIEYIDFDIWKMGQYFTTALTIEK